MFNIVLLKHVHTLKIFSDIFYYNGCSCTVSYNYNGCSCTVSYLCKYASNIIDKTFECYNSSFSLLHEGEELERFWGIIISC